MTPTEQDKELRQRIVVMLYNASDERDNKSVGQCADELLQLFTADRKRVALGARIDELTKLRRMFERLAEYAGEKELVMFEYDDRIAQLKAQQENPKDD